VSLPALAVYGILLITIFLGHRARISPERCRQVSLGLAPVILGAALWFVYLQMAKVHAWCKFCLATHGCACLAAVLLLGFYARKRRSGANLRPVEVTWCLLSSALGLAVLVGGQLAVGKRLYGLARISGPMALQGSQLSLHRGRFTLEPAELPRIGGNRATNYVVSIFDYTCSHCRALHPLLKAAAERYGEKLGVVCLPVPLDASCNPLIQRTAAANEGACDYAKLSLAVWQTRPEAFGDFDDWLFAGAKVPPLDQARAKAQSLLGKEDLQRCLETRWVSGQLQWNVELYIANSQAIGNGRLPQLIIGDAVMYGAVERLEDLLRLIGPVN
jgi:hypothetical protein